MMHAYPAEMAVKLDAAEIRNDKKNKLNENYQVCSYHLHRSSMHSMR